MARFIGEKVAKVPRATVLLGVALVPNLGIVIINYSSCVNDRNEESPFTGSFGPVTSGNLMSPTIRLGADGQNVCGGNNKVKVYRRIGMVGPFNNLTNLSTPLSNPYNFTDPVFVDVARPTFPVQCAFLFNPTDEMLYTTAC